LFEGFVDDGVFVGDIEDIDDVGFCLSFAI
jgi:hypothetical protein